MDYIDTLHTLIYRTTIREYRRVSSITRFPRDMSTTSESRRPLVGVAAIILNPADQLLVGKRKGSHGAGELVLVSKKTYPSLPTTKQLASAFVPSGRSSSEARKKKA